MSTDPKHQAMLRFTGAVRNAMEDYLAENSLVPASEVDTYREWAGGRLKLLEEKIDQLSDQIATLQNRDLHVRDLVGKASVDLEESMDLVGAQIKILEKQGSYTQGWMSGTSERIDALEAKLNALTETK